MNVIPESMLCPNRQLALEREARRCSTIPGCFAEFGVAAGGSALILRLSAPKKTLHLFDSFEGLPAPGPYDRSTLTVGACRRTASEMWNTLREYGEENIYLHSGLFKNTLPHLCVPLSLAHIDCDLYEGTKLCLETVMPLLHPSGAIIVDDYHPDFFGVMKAVNECASSWSKLIIRGTPHDSVILFR